MKISWQTLNVLEEKYGDSFFILDLRKFEHNYKNFLEEFRSIYPNTNLGYSYKTNYIPRICQSVHAMGGYAEVVSQMEYDLAIKIGVPPNRIIFNGPLKQQEDLEQAILAGSIVNLDCMEEVEIVRSLAARYSERQIDVGIRCNFDIGADRISRFGFDSQGGDIDRVFEIFESIDNCNIVGLHCHISTGNRSIESYSLRTQKILELNDRYFTKKPPKYIDIGGGFFGNMEADLKQQFDCHIPTYPEYARAIAHQLKSKFPDDNCPQLIIEPGVAVVADVLTFAAKIVGIKTVRSRQIALAVGSIHNVKPTGSDKKLSMKVYKSDIQDNLTTSNAPVDIVGYTCMEHDCLYKDYPEPVSIGDYLVVDNMGAYTIVFKPPFIRANPPIISYDSVSDEYSLIRRRETAEDVFSTYVI
jgi:diaminopimelate decarboxylase